MRTDRDMRGQVAFEYLVIVGMVLTMLLITWAYLAGIQRNTSEQLSISYAKNTANKIAGIADMVYAQGEPASVETLVYMPNNINAVQLSNREINFQVQTSGGLADVYAITQANLTGNLSANSGYYYVVIRAQEDSVLVFSN